MDSKHKVVFQNLPYQDLKNVLIGIVSEASSIEPKWYLSLETTKGLQCS